MVDCFEFVCLWLLLVLFDVLLLCGLDCCELRVFVLAWFMMLCGFGLSWLFVV